MLGGLMTVIGGFSTLVMFIEFLDSLRLFGPTSVLVNSPASLAGFLLYGTLPILFYTAGIGLITGRPWAWRAVVFIIPVIMLFYFFNFACNLTRHQLGTYDGNPSELFAAAPEVFFSVFLRYLLLFGPLIFYFHQPNVTRFFQEETPKLFPPASGH